jgi:hypothetical protein
MKRLLVIAAAGVVGAVGPARAVLPDDLAAGTRVSLEGTLSASGEVVADKVKLLRAPAGRDEIEGAIEQVDAAARSLVVGGVRIELRPDTAVKDGSGTPIDFSGVRPGQAAEAAGSFEGGRLLASSLEVDELEDGEARRLEVDGAISAADPMGDSFQVLGLRVRVAPRTWVGLD